MTATIINFPFNKVAAFQGHAMTQPKDLGNANQAPAPGDKMPDGTIYIGISPETHRPFYAAPADLPMRANFNEAVQYAKGLEVGGKKDFRVPNLSELDILFRHRAKGSLKGTFHSDQYWSATPSWRSMAFIFLAEKIFAIRFKDGAEKRHHSNSRLSVRCVR